MTSPNLCGLLDIRIVAQCQPSGCEGITVALIDSTPCQLWLVNRSQVSRDVGACELFGFNVGVFTDKPQGKVLAVKVGPQLLQVEHLYFLAVPGTARTLRDSLVPFNIKADTSLLVLSRSGKTLTCLAEIACDSVQSLGLTELSMEGHDLEPQTKDCNPSFYQSVILLSVRFSSTMTS